MIFLLDFILLLNVVIAYQLFRNILAPAMLVGIGMLGSAIVASLHYQPWEMHVMQIDTVLLLGISTLFFTIMCSLFKKKSPPKTKISRDRDISLKKFNLKRIEFILVLLTVCGALSCYLKIKNYISFFGTGLSLSELIFEYRIDGWTGEREFQLPKYVIWLSNIGNFTFYFSAWLLSIHIISKNKNRRLLILLILQIILSIIDGIINGTKGSMLDPITKFITIYLFLLYAKRFSYNLPPKTLWVIIGLFIFFVLGFRSISSIIGRDMEWKNNTDVFSIYMGAQIKNFDIYMHGYDGNPPNQFWGEESFWMLHKGLHPDYIRVPRQFQSVGNCSLGNVYTQIYSFHKDFGILGVFIMLVLIAFLSMFAYNRALYVMKKPMQLNIWLFIYSAMAMPLFMSFFSSRFTEQIITVSFLKTIVYIWILKHLFFFLQKRNR